MAASFVNFHVKSEDAAAVARAAREIVYRRAMVSPSTNGWVTVCDETCESQETNEIDRLAREFSGRLQTALFTFLVPDYHVFAYYLFREGDLIDEYNSTPEQFGPIEEEALDRLAGKPSMVLRYCHNGATAADVKAILVRSQSGLTGGFGSSASALDRAHQLAGLLGIERARASINYFDLLRNRLQGGEEFTRVESNRLQRPLRKPIPPRIPPR
jgi:hypothetical protein